MKTAEAKRLVVEAGKALLQQRLVARTWGNVSCRIDDKSYVITPSGLDYNKITPEDTVTMNIADGTWTGNRKPSGERKIHTEAYQLYSDAGFVIHTHQDYATAIGLAGFKELDITDEEKQALEGIELAEYGLPGTGKLTGNVRKALKTGAHVILMKHHGVLICGKDMEDTMTKAILLEEICKRNVNFHEENKKSETDKELIKQIKQVYPCVELVQTPVVCEWAQKGLELRAQVDDMAQMLGKKIPVVENNASEILGKLNKYDAVIVKNHGIIVKASEEDDMKAIALLVNKAVICAMQTSNAQVPGTLSRFDTALMRIVYKKKYSKQK